MFKLTDIKSVKWPVTVNVPQDGGTVKKYEFTAQFELIGQKEYDDFYKPAKGEEPAGEKDVGLTRRVLTGWGNDVCDEDGNPIEFNAENLERMISKPYARVAIVNAYFDCAYGNKSAAAKN